jgi:hypothetical protein
MKSFETIKSKISCEKKNEILIIWYSVIYELKKDSNKKFIDAIKRIHKGRFWYGLLFEKKY